MDNYEQTPFQGLLGGYYEYQRPLMAFSDLNSESAEDFLENEENKKQKNSLEAPSIKAQSNASYEPHISDPMKEDRPDNSKPISEMTIGDLEKERNQLEWVHRNVGGLNTQRRNGNGNNLQPHHYAQTVVGMSVPLIGLASGLVNYVAEQRLDTINAELQKRNDSSSLKKTAEKQQQNTTRPAAHGNLLHQGNRDYKFAERRDISPSSFWESAKGNGNIHDSPQKSVENRSYEPKSNHSARDEIDFF